MNNISQIKIKSYTTYCSIEHAYEDELIIKPNSISYKCKPKVQNSVSWKYTSNSDNFISTYNKICENFLNLFKAESEKTISLHITDAVNVDIYITYSDETQKDCNFTYYDKLFINTISSIISLVPTTEELPKIMDLDCDES